MEKLAELEELVLAKGRGRLERLVENATMSQEEADAKFEQATARMRTGGLMHALGTPQPATKEAEKRNLARGEQGPEAEDPPTPAKPGDLKEEAERACSSGQQRSVINAILDLKSVRPPKADIQNKANKTCSVCEVTFDIRKSFIEHCQLVHGMRFKTKSGLSIPPPPVPEAQDGSPDPPTPAKPGDQKEKAKRAYSSGQQRSVIDAILDVSSEDGENQATSYVEREPGGTDPLGLSDCGEEDAPSSETSEEEDSSWKDSASEEEGQRHPGRSSRGGPAPPGGRTGGRVRRRAAPSSESEEEPQTEVEDVAVFGLNPGSTGRAARRAEQ